MLKAGSASAQEEVTTLLRSLAQDPENRSAIAKAGAQRRVERVAAIAEAASDAGLPLRLRRLGIPDQWIPCGSQSDQKKMAWIDADAIMTALRQLVANIPG